jgi:hypothetical protein
MEVNNTQEKLWTEDEDNLLRSGVEKGLNLTLLASDLDRSWASLSKRIKMTGLKLLPVKDRGRLHVLWEVHNLNPHQELPSGR